MVLKLETTVERYSNDAKAVFIGSENLPITKKFITEDEVLHSIMNRVKKITNKSFDPNMLAPLSLNNESFDETIVYNHVGEKENKVIKIKAMLDGKRIHLLDFILKKAS